VKDYGSFLTLLKYAGDSTKKEIESLFAGFAGATPAPSLSLLEREPVMPNSQSSQTDFGGVLDTNNTSENADQVLAVASREELNQALTTTVEEVQGSLRELADAITSPQSALLIETPETSATPDVLDTSTDVQQPTSNTLPEHVATALKSAEDRVTQLQNELEQDRAERKYSDEKIKTLTDELDALNERLQTANEVLSIPDISESDRANLIEGIMTNIQLTLEHLEKRLQEESAQNQSYTIGEVIARTIYDTVSGFIQGTTGASRSIIGLIGAFFTSIFSALFGV
jgi:hypothetical protein